MKKKISLSLTMWELETLVDWGNHCIDEEQDTVEDDILLNKLTQKMRLEHCAEKAREMQNEEGG